MQAIVSGTHHPYGWWAMNDLGLIGIYGWWAFFCCVIAFVEVVAVWPDSPNRANPVMKSVE